MIRLILILVALCLLVASQAQATVYWISPGGTGSTCSEGSPCSWSTGRSNAVAGDIVRFKNGNYAGLGVFETIRAGTTDNYITFEAETKLGARWSHNATCGTTGGALVFIKHDWTKVRGIHFDFCGHAGAPAGFSMGDNASFDVHNLMIEHVRVSNTTASGFHCSTNSSNIILRHNLLDGTGNDHFWGEGFYQNCDNVTMYGNTFRRFTENGLDIRDNSTGHIIHHNIFEDQVPSIDQNSIISGCSDCGSGPAGRGWVAQGTIELKNGGNSEIYSNILRNNKSGWGPLNLGPGDNIHIHDNVWYGFITTPNVTNYHIRGSDGSNNELEDNIACNMNTYNCNSCGTVIFTNNQGFNGSGGSGVSQSICDAREAVILSEFPSLPGYSYGGGAVSPTFVRGFYQPTNNVLTILLDDPNGGISGSAGFTCTKDAGAWTISSTDCASGRCSLTMADDPLSTDALLCSYSQGSGDVVDSAEAELVAFSGQAVTNYVGRILNADNIIESSNNFAADRPLAACYDLNIVSEASSCGNSGQSSFNVTHDFGTTINVQSVSAVCDNTGSWTTNNIDIEVSANCSDYTQVVDAGVCNTKEWHNFNIVQSGVKCTKLTLNSITGSVQAFEMKAEEGSGESIVFAAAEDAFVCEMPDTCGNGNRGTMVVQHTTFNEFRSLVKFDLSALTLSSISSATLTVTAINASGSLVVKAFSIGDSWAEGSVSWATMPSLGTQQATDTVTGAGEATFDITSYVSAQFAGDKVVSVILLDDGPDAENDGVLFRSKEGGIAATLTIEGSL